MNTTNHTSPSGEDAANGAIGGREAAIKAALDVLLKVSPKSNYSDYVWIEIRKAREGLSALLTRAALTAEKVAAEPVAVELSSVAERLAEGDGFWRSCSGCHETNEGHETGHYPYSTILKCVLGGGCSECGGIGAVWDNTDYGAMADALHADMIERENAAPQQPAQSAEQDERSTGICFFCGEPIDGKHESDCPQANLAAVCAANGAIGEREAFEAWGNETFNYGFLPETWDDGSGPFAREAQYTHEGTQMAWEGWQARAALPAEKVAAEPVALQHVAVAEDGGKLRWMTGRRPRDCELYAMPDGGRAPKLYAAPAAALENGDGPDAWISVEERMPDEDSVVLVSAWEYGKLDGKRFTLVARRSGSLFLNEETGDDLYTPTHWQPLPAAPAALSQKAGEKP